MQELPQQPPECQVVIPVDGGECSNTTCDGISYEILERPSPPQTKLEEKDLFSLACYLSAKYEKGYTWAELPLIMKEIVSFIGPNPEMDLEEKKKDAIEVIHYLMVTMIAHADALYLPEKATDPFFEELFPPYIELALSFPSERKLIKPSRNKPLTDVNINEYAQTIGNHFEEGLTWKNLACATRHALIYILTYENLKVKDRKDGAFAIIKRLLLETDPSRLPPYFDKKLFKEFLEGFIEIIL